MNFEDDEEDVLDRLHDSMEKLDHGETVEPVEHAPGVGDNHSNVYGKDWFTKNRLPMGEAMVDSGLSFLGNAPRNPNLMPGEGPEYSTIKYAEGEYAYTNVAKSTSRCERCSRRRMITFNVEFVVDNGQHLLLGNVAACKVCDRDHWIFTQHVFHDPYRPFQLPTGENIIVAGWIVAFLIILFLATR